MRIQRMLLTASALLLVILFNAGATDIANVMSYQGRLTDLSGTPIANQTVTVEFRIYNAPVGGGVLWSESQSVTTDDNGIINVMLGEITPLADTAFNGSDCWLGITVVPDPEISPRTRMGSTPYSFEYNEAGPESTLVSSGNAIMGKAVGNSTGSLLGSMVGISGLAQNSSSGEAYGGYFLTSAAGSGNRFGLKAECFGSASSFTCGVSSTYGVYGYAENSTTNCSYGMYAIAKSGSIGTAVGGHFEAPSFGNGPHLGVRGIASGDASGFGQIGVVGAATNTTGQSVGIQGTASSTSTGDAYGGYFLAENTGTGTHYGVYAVETSGGSGAAVYAAGDQIASGTKSAVLHTSRGDVLYYALESPEVWFEDVGEGRLQNGRAHIELDPTFLETVAVTAESPMKVFIQLNDPDCQGTAVVRGLTGFDVIELRNGTSDAAFTFRVMAKRRGYEELRHPATKLGENDPNIYPEVWNRISERFSTANSGAE